MTVLQRDLDLRFHLVPTDEDGLPSERAICGITSDPAKLGDPDHDRAGWYRRRFFDTDLTTRIDPGEMCQRCLIVVQSLYNHRGNEQRTTKQPDNSETNEMGRGQRAHR